MNIISIYKWFPKEVDCISYLEQVRWQNKPVCPYCKSTNSTRLLKEQRHHCNNCNTTFSVTINTIFHHTHLPLQKWLLAVSLVLNAKKGIAARQLARDLEVNKNTAWRMAMKIRRAMIDTEQRNLLTRLIEMNENYIGGKPRKGNSREKPKRGRRTKKIPVIEMIKRGGEVRANVAKDGHLYTRQLTELVRRNIDITNSILVTDEFSGYIGTKSGMPHETINHAVWHVAGFKHTNNIESFWALLKRSIVGQYHKVSLRYLPRYIDEFYYQYNNRTNIDLFAETIARSVGTSVV
jgi:transposase-like protein